MNSPIVSKPPKLLTREEVAQMRQNLESVIQVSDHEWSVLATLEWLYRSHEEHMRLRRRLWAERLGEPLESVPKEIGCVMFPEEITSEQHEEMCRYAEKLVEEGR